VRKLEDVVRYSLRCGFWREELKGYTIILGGLDP
jgi:hypothetical protein